MVVKHRPREDGCREDRDERKSAQLKFRPLSSPAEDDSRSPNLFSTSSTSLRTTRCASLCEKCFGSPGLGRLEVGLGVSAVTKTVQCS